MGFVVAAFTLVASAIATTVIPVVSAIVATISGVVTTVVATVGSVIAGITSAIGGIVAPLINTVGGIVKGISLTIGEALKPIAASVKTAVSHVATDLELSIIKIKGAINATVAPVLNPIKDTLAALHSYIVNTHGWVFEILEPVRTAIEIANTASSLMMIKTLLSDYEGITVLINEAAERNDLGAAQAIAELYRSIVHASTGLMEMVNEHMIAFDDKVIHAEERIKEANRLAIEELNGKIQEKFIRFEQSMKYENYVLERRVERVSRRTEDLPYFSGMLIKALR